MAKVARGRFYKAFYMDREGRLKGPSSDYHYNHGKLWSPRHWDLVPCERGWHVFAKRDVSWWASRRSGRVIYEVQVRGIGIRDSHKAVFSQIRLVRKVKGTGLNAIKAYEKRYPKAPKHEPED